MTTPPSAPAPELIQLVVGILGLSPEDLTGTSARAAFAEWSSLRHLQIVAAVEDRYGVSLTPREIRSISDVKDIDRILRERGVTG